MNKVLRYLAAALAAFATASTFAVDANTCDPTKGCNDPNAMAVSVPGTVIGIQKPADVSATIKQKVGITVVPDITTNSGTPVLTNKMRSLCISFDPAKPCPPDALPPRASVVSHEPSRTIVATGSAVSASVPATGPFKPAAVNKSAKAKPAKASKVKSVVAKALPSNWKRVPASHVCMPPEDYKVLTRGVSPK